MMVLSQMTSTAAPAPKGTSRFILLLPHRVGPMVKVEYLLEMLLTLNINYHQQHVIYSFVILAC